jgi:hypothetical protein
MNLASKPLFRVLSLLLLSATPALSADGDDVAENVKKASRDAGHAVAGAGEKVSDRIQGKSSDGELVEGARTNTGRGYGPAGCGLGSILFEPNSGWTQVLAATTNTSFGTQTFGITSGTSNCNAPGKGKKAARAFIETNRVALAKDIARGSGETIDGLSRISGCSSAAQVGVHLQQRFTQLFPDAARSDRDVSDAVIGTLRADAALGCRELG